MILFDCQSTTAKMMTHSNCPLVTCLLASLVHCGSDASASASKNWSTKVDASKPTTNQALNKENRRWISEISPQWCQTVIEISSKDRKCPSKAEKDIYLMCCSIHNSKCLMIKSKFTYFLKNVFYLKFKFSVLVGTPYIKMVSLLQNKANAARVILHGWKASGALLTIYDHSLRELIFLAENILTGWQFLDLVMWLEMLGNVTRNAW